MKVKEQIIVSLTVTVFDDEQRWVHVGVMKSGEPSRQVYMSPQRRHLTDEDLDLAVMHLDELARTWVNRFRHHQPALF